MVNSNKYASEINRVILQGLGIADIRPIRYGPCDLIKKKIIIIKTEWLDVIRFGSDRV